MVLRKAVDVSEKLFNKMGILKELTYHVVESLGDVYPEISQNINRVYIHIYYYDNFHDNGDKDLLLKLLRIIQYKNRS